MSVSRAVTAFVIEDDGSVTFCAADGTQVTLNAGGGSQAGVPIYHAFSFAFDTAGLATGKAIYTPTIGDLLLDAWVEVDTIWDGTGNGSYTDPFGNPHTGVGPLADIGQFVGTQWGIFANLAKWALAGPDSQGCIDLTGSGLDGTYDSKFPGGTPGLKGWANCTLSQLSILGQIQDNLVLPDPPNAFAQFIINDSNPFVPLQGRIVPAKFVTADPLKLVVSQDGTNTGGDPGATHGAAVLYLVTVTPS